MDELLEQFKRSLRGVPLKSDITEGYPVKDVATDLQSYRKFLESIPLDRYRNEFKDVKWIEQDLYPQLLPQDSIYKNYWDRRRQNFLDFDVWFEQFWKELYMDDCSAQALKAFKKYYYNLEGDGWFKRGFKARMYRTWVPVLTQLDFCYMLAYVLEKQNLNLRLEVNARLDAKGIDIRVANMDFNVGKISQRKEARGTIHKNIIPIRYPVYDMQNIERLSRSPRARPENRKKYKAILQAFHKYFISLTNGFVVFQEYYIEQVVKELDNLNKLKVVIKGISAELSGEKLEEES